MTGEVNMIECPALGCDVRLPEHDIKAQREHMESEHPEIIRERLEAAGFRQGDDGWVDTLNSDG